MSKKYSHAFQLAFTVESDNEGEDVTNQELLTGLTKRLADLIECDEIDEACGLPIDTYEM